MTDLNDAIGTGIGLGVGLAVTDTVLKRFNTLGTSPRVRRTRRKKHKIKHHR